MKNKKKLFIIITIICVFIIASIVITVLVLNNKNPKSNSNDPSITEDNKPIEQNENLDNKNDNSQDNKENNDEKEDSNLDNQENSKTVDTKKEDNKKNTNTKNNSSSKNNSANNNSNTQTNTQNTTSNSSSNQLIPVGTTYSGNGTKVTILDGNKARLEYNGGTWITDVVDRTGAGVQYNISFKHKAGSGSPKYYYQSSILFPMSMSVMSNNINGAGGIHISGVSSNLGSVVNKMYVGKANGYSCIPNLNSLNAGGNDGCSSWASTVKGNVSSSDYDYTTYYVFNDKMEVLGYVFLEARLKPENEWAVGTNIATPENWNVKQLYK